MESIVLICVYLNKQVEFSYINYVFIISTLPILDPHDCGDILRKCRRQVNRMSDEFTWILVQQSFGLTDSSLKRYDVSSYWRSSSLSLPCSCPSPCLYSLMVQWVGQKRLDSGKERVLEPQIQLGLK